MLTVNGIKFPARQVPYVVFSIIHEWSLKLIWNTTSRSAVPRDAIVITMAQGYAYKQ